MLFGSEGLSSGFQDGQHSHGSAKEAQPAMVGGDVLVALSGWQLLLGCDSLSAMAHVPNPYRGFRYPVEVIQHAVWLYHCFSLSLRGVETILAACGVVVSYESIREWGLRFGGSSQMS